MNRGASLAYQIRVIAPVTREATIATKVAAATEKHTIHAFRNRRSDLPVIQVPIDLPVYRMENFRTFTDQKDFIAGEGKPADYFAAGQESEEVQQAQHGLLYRLALKGKADSVVPVSAVLAEDGQQQPLLITATGVVVNGNRRLAAMRELYAEPNGSHTNFSHIDVMVLPADANADEILDVEANLQAMPETRLDYDWIGEAQLIKQLVSLGRTHKQVADQLRRAEKDIKYAVQTLAEADLYLKEAKGTKGCYSEIREDAEQLFGDLPKLLEGKSENEKSVSRVIAWTLYQNKDKLPGRLYDFNAVIGKHADDVLDRVASELGEVLDPVSEGDEDENDFDIDLDAEPAAPGAGVVIDALKSEDNEAAVDALIEAAITVIELEKGKKSGDTALKTVGQAHTKLLSVDLSKASANTLPGIAKQLDSIKAIVAGLEATLKKLTNP